MILLNIHTNSGKMIDRRHDLVGTLLLIWEKQGDLS